jgi:hypothetical protein
MEGHHSHKEMCSKQGNNYTWTSDNMKNVSRKGSCDVDAYYVTSVSV